jgi:hypothetical protein
MAHHRTAPAGAPVIVFGSSIADPQPYRDYAQPGIERAAGPGDTVLAYAAVGPISRTYNLLLDAATAHEDLEALVLVDAHAEIADPGFAATVRATLGDGDVAIAGCAGASGVTSVAWWEGAVSRGRVIHRYEEHGGGDLPALDWSHPSPAPARVDAVDGVLLVLSPWAVRNLRFDERLRNHGFDLDLCLQARAAGRAVSTMDVQVVHHRALELIGDIDLWVESHVQVAEKWGAQLTGEPADEDGWRARARRAEAEREAARAVAYSNGLIWDARILQLEREMERLTGTREWRLTEPLRRGNALARRLRGRS